jgi:hypothetical protein
MAQPWADQIHLTASGYKGIAAAVQEAVVNLQRKRKGSEAARASPPKRPRVEAGGGTTSRGGPERGHGWRGGAGRGWTPVSRGQPPRGRGGRGYRGGWIGGRPRGSGAAARRYN